MFGNKTNQVKHVFIKHTAKINLHSPEILITAKFTFQTNDKRSSEILEKEVRNKFPDDGLFKI